MFFNKFIYAKKISNYKYSKAQEKVFSDLPHLFHDSPSFIMNNHFFLNPINDCIVWSKIPKSLEIMQVKIYS